MFNDFINCKKKKNNNENKHCKTCTLYLDSYRYIRAGKLLKKVRQRDFYLLIVCINIVHISFLISSALAPKIFAFTPFYVYIHIHKGKIPTGEGAFQTLACRKRWLGF